MQLELSVRQCLSPAFCLCFILFFSFFSQCSDRCLVSVLGERGAVQTAVCFQESVWKRLFLQNAALVTIGIQCISQPGMRKSVLEWVSIKARILKFDLEQNFRDFLPQKGGFPKRWSPKLKWMKETYRLLYVALLLGRVNLALKRLQTNCDIYAIRTWTIRIYV